MIVFKKIRWKNFLSTGNRFLEIDFLKSKTTLIAGENGAGKSTVLDALCFSLFGKTFRKINIPQLVNSINERDMVVEVEFSIGRKEFKVCRGMCPRLFEIYVDGKLLNQDSKSRDYQKYLESSVLKLNYKSFTQVVVLGSSTFVPFMQLTAADRRAIIEDLLDIQIFSTMNVLLKQRVLELKDEMTAVDYKVQLMKDKIENQKSFIKKLAEMSKDNIDKKKAEVTEANGQATTIQAEVDELRDQVEALLAQVKDKATVEGKLSYWEDLEKKIERNARRAREDIKFFEETDNCPTCEQLIDDTFRTKTLGERADKIGELEDALKKIEEEITGVGERLSSINAVLNEVQSLEADVSERNTSIAVITRYISKVQDEISALLDKEDVTDKEKVTLQDLRDDVERTTKRRDGLLDDRHYYEIAYTLLRDSGIKTKIVKHYLPIMNKLINKYLGAMDFFVQFTLDENFKEQIKSRHRDDFSYGSFSEGEKLRIDLALLFTWREVSRMKNSANTNLLILDEVFDSSLDAAGTEEFLKLLHALAGKTNVFVITHKADILTDKFDSQIVFQKKKGFTRIA